MKEYIQNKENACINQFKARPFDKNQIQKSAGKSPTESVSTNSVAVNRITECSPFNFKTEERLKLKHIDNNNSSAQQ